MEKAVIVQDLSKSYISESEKKLVLDNLNFEIPTNQLFGIIGPDGAGKSTLFKILATLILPDNGSANILGLDTKKDYSDIRHLIGYMPGKFSLYQDLSVEENLEFFSTIFGVKIEDNFELIEDIYKSLLPFKKRKAANLSGGMKQKLALCCSLIHRPKLLILDEPTTGVDPVSRQEFWDVLSRLKNLGISIIVSTPYMDEATRCDKIAFMMSGKILKIENPKTLIENFGKKIISASADSMFKLLSDIRKHPAIEYAFAFGNANHAVLKDERFSLEELNSYLSEKGNTHIYLKDSTPCIEDCFMDLIQ